MKEGEPGENLARLQDDLILKAGLAVSVETVAGWPLMKRHVARSWLDSNGKDPAPDWIESLRSMGALVESSSPGSPAVTVPAPAPVHVTATVPAPAPSPAPALEPVPEFVF